MPTAPSFPCLCRRQLAIWALTAALAVAAAFVVSATPVRAQADTPTAAAASSESGGGMTAAIAKVVNFAILVGVLVYYLKGPLVRYLAGRGDTIRRDLVDAKALRATSAERLRAIEARRATLPAEVDALRARGREELARERVRMKEATAREREKVLELTRREIDVQFRNARRDLVEHAAEIAMKLAEARIAAGITPDDQARLVDRYVAEVHQ